VFRKPRSSLVQLRIVPVNRPDTVLGTVDSHVNQRQPQTLELRVLLGNLCRHLHVSELLKQNKTYNLSSARKNITDFLIISILKLISLLF